MQIISRTVVFIVSAITMPLFADVSFEDPKKFNINAGVRVLSDTFSLGSGKTSESLSLFVQLTKWQSC